MTIQQVELKIKGACCTPEALGFEHPDSANKGILWVPRSQIQNLDELLDDIDNDSLWGVDEMVTVHLPVWLIEKEELDAYAEETEDEVY